MALQVGEIVVVPINVTLIYDGIEQEMATKGEKSTVLQRLFDNVDTDTGEDIFTYLLQFSKSYDIVNSSGIIEITTSEFWFHEYELTGKESKIEDLPVSSQVITSQMKENRTTTSVNLAQGEKILKKVPSDENVFRNSMENLVSILEDASNASGSVEYNPKLQSSVEQIISDLTGSTLKTLEGDVILGFLRNLQIQQERVSANSENLQRDSNNSANDITKTLEAEHTSVDKFFQRAQNAKGLESLLTTADTYTPIDWNAVDPGPPDLTSLPTYTDAQLAAGRFPLLDPSSITTSGLV